MINSLNSSQSITTVDRYYITEFAIAIVKQRNCLKPRKSKIPTVSFCLKWKKNSICVVRLVGIKKKFEYP